MKYLVAHPKIKEIVAKNFFTTSMEVERNLSMGAQTLVCSEFFETAVKTYGSKVIAPMLEFLDRYIGTHPHVGTEWDSWTTLEFCTFLGDGSRDGIQIKLDHEQRVIDGEELVIKVKIVQLIGIFGVTTEKVLKEITL
jgi:hypothetical protein